MEEYIKTKKRVFTSLERWFDVKIANLKEQNNAPHEQTLNQRQSNIFLSHHMNNKTKNIISIFILYMRDCVKIQKIMRKIEYIMTKI